MNSLLNGNQTSTLIFIVVFIWSIFWKGVALWRSAAAKQRNWFIGLLVLNTIGILEITYLFFFAKEKMKLKDFKIWSTK